MFRQSESGGMSERERVVKYSGSLGTWRSEIGINK